jgi:hypothetical protein
MFSTKVESLKLSTSSRYTSTVVFSRLATSCSASTYFFRRPEPSEKLERNAWAFSASAA